VNAYKIPNGEPRFLAAADVRKFTATFPPGASKWNPIEHRLFGPISGNWAGEPLVSYETILKYIRTTRTETGLHCRARLDTKEYPVQQRVAPQDKARVRLKRRSIRPQLNYTIYPHGHGQDH